NPQTLTNLIKQTKYESSTEESSLKPTNKSTVTAKAMMLHTNTHTHTHTHTRTHTHSQPHTHTHTHTHTHNYTHKHIHWFAQKHIYINPRWRFKMCCEKCLILISYKGNICYWKYFSLCMLCGGCVSVHVHVCMYMCMCICVFVTEKEKVC